MKKIAITLGLMASCCLMAKTDMIVVDRIEAVVLGPVRNDVITLSDARRPGIDGRSRTANDIVNTRKIYQIAEVQHLVNDEGAEKSLKVLQRDNNLSNDALDAMFLETGYSPADGREEFKMLNGVSSAISMNVTSKTMVSEQDILDQYNKAPEMLEESYCLKRAEVALAQADSAVDLRTQLKERTFKPVWSSEYWIDRSEIDTEKAFIFDMSKGQLRIDKNRNSYELLRLVDKKEVRPAPLDKDRRAAIENELHQKKFIEEMRAFNETVDEEVAVLRF